MPHNFYPGDIRSGQFRDLPIISLLGNMKMLTVSHKPTEAVQFFQDHGHSPQLWWSGCSWRSGAMGRSPEVKWGHNTFFSRISGDRMEIEMRKWCQTTWLVEPLRSMCNVHIELRGSWFDLDLTLTCPEINFEIDLSTCFKLARRGGHDDVIFIFYIFHIKKWLMKNHLREER